MLHDSRCRRRCLSYALLFAVASALAPHLAAASLLPLTFDELVSQADAIVRCDVVDVRSEWRQGRDDRAIVTVVTIRVRSVLKGSSRDLVLLEFPGGTVDDITMRVAGTPRFAAGDEEFLFLGAGHAVSPLVGFSLGRFSIRHDAFTGRVFVTSFDGRAFRSPLDFSHATRAAAQTGFPHTAVEQSASVGLSDGDFESLVRDRVRRAPRGR